MIGDKLTADDVLDIVGDRAQWCREEGECDMRNITHMVSSIRDKIKNGDSRQEIILSYSEED